MSDYTPTTEEVRDDYCGTWSMRNSRAEFDRWLAEVKAQAWEEGASANWDAQNPYRIIVSNNDYDQLRHALDNE